MLSAFDSIAFTNIWRFTAACALVWLAIKFGLTLRTGRIALIEQIARIGNPNLSPRLCLYTRRLTIVWCIYFVLAVLYLFIDEISQLTKGFSIGLCSIVFFVGEHRVRPYLFPEEKFPNIYQQIRDTWTIWKQNALNNTPSQGRDS